MWLQESHLIWVENQLLNMLRTRQDSMMDEEELEEEVECCDIDVTNINLNTNYSLAKRPPHYNLTIENLMEKFSTTNFLPTFLCHNLSGTTITPGYHNHFDAYNQIIISLPCNQYLGDHILMDRVRTLPSINASGQALAKAAHFDTAFVAEDLALYKSEGGISGK